MLINNLHKLIIYGYTVKPALVTTSIKQQLILCDLNFDFPLQCISY
jgi:hypothetical protein